MPAADATPYPQPFTDAYGYLRGDFTRSATRVARELRDLADRVEQEAANGPDGNLTYAAGRIITTVHQGLSHLRVGRLTDAAKAADSYPGEQTLRAYEDFARWLVAMDEPGNADRQTVNLTQIIERARALT